MELVEVDAADSLPRLVGSQAHGYLSDRAALAAERFRTSLKGIEWAHEHSNLITPSAFPCLVVFLLQAWLF